MCKLKQSLLVSVMILITAGAKAQLYFRNNSTVPVEVAYALMLESKDYRGWFTNGWFKVEPGQRVKLSKAIGTHNILYYYARSTDGSLKYTGNMNMLVDPVHPFMILNANMAYTRREHPEYLFMLFRPVAFRNGMLTRQYTIQFNN